MNLPDSSILTNIQVQGHTRLREMLFEKQYIQVRSLEGRLYPDDELICLPDIGAAHPHYSEWQWRKRSARRLIRYLASKKQALEILEVGCGNGWLTHLLAEIPGALVTGTDINFTELQQAARVFSDDPNLRFIHGDIRAGILGDRRFDVIVFAAAIEHFPSIKKIVHLCLGLLRPYGEIHIIDTPFCRPEQVKVEERRTVAYYTSFGYPEMAEYYYHHTLAELRSFRFAVRYNPRAMYNRGLSLFRFLRRVKVPHPWICIKKY